MGLGSESYFDEPKAQMFQDGLDDLPAFDKPDVPAGSPKTLRTSQEINLINPVK